MMKYAKFIQDIFDQYKCKSSSDSLKCISVFNNGKVYAYLRPITQDYKTSLPYCIKLLGQWRMDNPNISTGKFKVTQARTEKWLIQHVINKPYKILFLIFSLSGDPLGHIGLDSFNFEDKSCELDSVLRGVKNIYPGLMTQSVHALLNWGIKELKLNKITLKVFSDNLSAIRFYENCGFYYIRSIPLIKVVFLDEEKWEIDPNIKENTAERYYSEMQLDISSWLNNKNNTMKGLISKNE